MLSKTATCVVSPGITGDLTTMLNYLNAYKACFLAESLGGYSLDDVAIVLKVAVTWFLMYANPRYSSSKPPSLDYQITFGRQASVEKWLHLSLFYSVFLLPCFPCVENQQVGPANPSVENGMGGPKNQPAGGWSNTVWAPYFGYLDENFKQGFCPKSCMMSWVWHSSQDAIVANEGFFFVIPY